MIECVVGQRGGTPVLPKPRSKNRRGEDNPTRGHGSPQQPRPWVRAYDFAGKLSSGTDEGQASAEGSMGVWGVRVPCPALDSRFAGKCNGK